MEVVYLLSFKIAPLVVQVREGTNQRRNSFLLQWVELIERVSAKWLWSTSDRLTGMKNEESVP